MSTEDWWKGYRQILPIADHMGLAIVAVMHPETRQWHCSQLKGLPFGLASSVNQFSRVAAFVTAVSRRLLYSLCGHYVDDMALVEMSSIARCSSSASACAGALADLMGVKHLPLWRLSSVTFTTCAEQRGRILSHGDRDSRLERRSPT